MRAANLCLDIIVTQRDGLRRISTEIHPQFNDEDYYITTNTESAVNNTILSPYSTTQLALQSQVPQYSENWIICYKIWFGTLIINKYDFYTEDNDFFCTINGKSLKKMIIN